VGKASTCLPDFFNGGCSMWFARSQEFPMILSGYSTESEIRGTFVINPLQV